MDLPPLICLVDPDPTTARLLEISGFPVRAYASPLDLLHVYEPDRPGCVVLEMMLPEMSGLALQHLLLERGGRQPVIFVSTSANVTDAVKAIKAGAMEFLPKPCDPELLLQAVRDAVERDDQQRQQRKRERLERARIESLTDREHEVLGYVASGWLNKEIAAEVGISERTVKFHRANLMGKVGAASLADLVRLATETGLGLRRPPPGV
ncbi:response regulator transcription factor [Luteolibacter ambystomatis]|uniref:Response regulator transcription factor n=1 Tax=Luteolibacter ambystomatis TaxID=2824561 RepID=A0A975J2M6_9BACT|nr:LuxR C-terminal-related transcriptional regulator [Luteolibacter ambystomatis]QUE52910.1 response regulator transcription factor [Luteolibacter ambystomatis]